MVIRMPGETISTTALLILVAIIFVAQVGHVIMDIQDMRQRKRERAQVDAMLIARQSPRQSTLKMKRSSDSTPLTDEPGERRRNG